MKKIILLLIGLSIISCKDVKNAKAEDTKVEIKLHVFDGGHITNNQKNLPMLFM